MAKEKDAPVDDKTVLTSDPNEPIGDPVADNPNPEIAADNTPAPAPAGEDDDAPAAPPPPNPRAEAMKRAGERMKRIRAGEAEREEAPEPEPAPEPAAPAPTPEARESGPSAFPAPAADAEKRKFKLKVRQQDLEMDEDKVLELAQKAAAADSYFEDGKRFFEEAKQAREQSRTTAPGAPHQEQRADTSDEPVPEPTAASPGSPLKKLIEDIQFGGDPEELAARFHETVTTEARNAASQASVEQRFQEDHAHTLNTFKAMKEADSATFADPNAEAVMTRMLFDGYREDLRASGLSDQQIPTDRNAVVDLHRLSRIQGKPGIRAAEKILGDVKQGYVNWRGGNVPAAAPAPAPANQNPSAAPRPAPRVVVNRDERRQAIPTQPTRASAPPSVPQAEPRPRSREEKLATMRAARGQR